MTEQQLIGVRLAAARRNRGIKQVDLGATIGVSDQTISNWEVGLRTPRADLLRRVCLALDCSADYLLRLSSEMEHAPHWKPIPDPAHGADTDLEGPELG